MRAWVVDHQPIWSSQILHTEALRAAGRLGIPDDLVEPTLETVSLVLPGPSTFRAAGRLHPSMLRSLDALHLATALELGTDLEALITYDARQTGAAQNASLRVVAPS